MRAPILALKDVRLADGPVLVHSATTDEQVRLAQESLGTEVAGDLVERTLAEITRGLVDLGVRRLVVAGGETSVAVVEALGIDLLRIGDQVAPGVPWCAATLPDGGQLHVALKSGNFGRPDFFTAAFDALERMAD